MVHLLKEAPQVSFNLYFNLILEYIVCKGLSKVAQSAASGKEASSMAKDLIDSKDPKYTLFCREMAFVAIFAFFSGVIFPTLDGSWNIFATAQLLEHIENIFCG